ncbi:MAG TPA: ankyrin repeat domain-containing protein [Vicinamibacteria bacterium]|nr:ankyrin repeat domain-containing protein [Vicinamibacteria bacterium]
MSTVTMKELGLKSMLLVSVLVVVAASPVDLATSPSPVADAAQAADLQTVRALLRQGGDVNAAQGDGMTAIHWAALSNHLELAETLLYAGSNVKATTRIGAYTPLVLASRGGHAAMVERLLAAGSDANVVTDTGATPLMLAAASGSADAVRLLLDHGADVEARESSAGETALMFASASNRRDVIDLLVERGADPAVTTRVIDVPELTKEAEEAFRKRLERVRDERKAQAAAEGAQVAASEEEAEGGAKGAKQGGKNLFAKLFGWMVPNKEESEPESEDRRRRESYGDRVGQQGGMSALLLAARQGHLEAVEALLQAGADVNQVAEGSKTSPLLIATMNGHFDLASYLLERGADPNLASEPAAVTPLYSVINLKWAPRAGYPQPTAQHQQKLTHLDLMKALLEKGADPNARVTKKVWFTGYNFDRSGIDEQGATPFWRAAYGSDVGAMKLLKSFGADDTIPTKAPPSRPRVGNQQGREVKDVSGLPPVPVGGPALTPLHAASGAGYGEGFAANDHRNHPAGFMPAVRYLVEECGADVNARDHEGNTPLHNAAARGDVEMIQYLVSKGADVKLLNREGQSTADMANGPVQRIQPFPEALELLVSLGAVNNNKCVSC